MVGAGAGDGQSSSGGSVVGRKASWGSGGAIDVAAQSPINSARKMPSAERAMRAPARVLVIERKEIWKNVIKGSKE